jgi:hypothetical protein
LAGVVVAIAPFFGHLAADLFKGPTASMESLENLAHAIVAPFEFIENPLGRGLTVFFVDEFDIVHIVEVVGEATKELRDFLFGIAIEADEFGVLFPQGDEFAVDAKEEIALGDGIVEFEFRFGGIGHCMLS